MIDPQPMRDFALEVFFSKWEFAAKHHMTASDVESMALSDLLAMVDADEQAAFSSLWLGYTETWGAPDLRAAIAETYETMDAANILCLAGAGEGLYAVAKCLLEPGDHVIVPTPNYQSAETIPLTICAVDGVPLRLEAGADGVRHWRLDIDDVEKAIRPNTKLISINFPHNPTGLTLPRADLDRLVAICRRHGITIFSDEVYRGVETDPSAQAPQIADLYEKGVSLNVMSKAYGLPGLRIGWIASADQDLLNRVERYKHYLSICNSAPSERLALIALRARDAIFARNRALIAENLGLLTQLFQDFPGLVEWIPPSGGCVAFPRYAGPGDGESFCESLLKESGVLLLPSSIYRSALGGAPDGHFRISYGRDRVFKDGLAAMRRHLETRYRDHAA